MAPARGLARLKDRSLDRGDASASFLAFQDQHSILRHREHLDLSLKGLGIKLANLSSDTIQQLWQSVGSDLSTCRARLLPAACLSQTVALPSDALPNSARRVQRALAAVVQIADDREDAIGLTLLSPELLPLKTRPIVAASFFASEVLMFVRPIAAFSNDMQ